MGKLGDYQVFEQPGLTSGNQCCGMRRQSKAKQRKDYKVQSGLQKGKKAIEFTCLVLEFPLQDAVASPPRVVMGSTRMPERPGSLSDTRREVSILAAERLSFYTRLA